MVDRVPWEKPVQRQPWDEGTGVGVFVPGRTVQGMEALIMHTWHVLHNNGFLSSLAASPTSAKPPESPIPPPRQASAKIKHVVFVVKENRTFDEVLGDVSVVGSEPVNAMLSLARYGEDATVKDKDQPAVEHARVTPNHHALARRFAFSDNFYVDAEVSVDGHHWLVGNYPNEFVESAVPAATGKKLHFRPDPDAPGRLGILSSNSWPESFLEGGSLWEHLARHRLSFRNYGEGVWMSGSDEGPGLMPTGI